MQGTLERIAQLERELERAKAQLWREDAERLRILLRDISKEEKQRIMEGLTDKSERVLFGLEAPEEQKVAAAMKAGASGGDLTCTFCGKSGLTKKGLALHTARIHKVEKEREEEKVA